MSDWFTATAIANARIGGRCRNPSCRALAAETSTARGVRDHAKKCAWKSREATGRGGKRVEHHLSNFTDAQQLQLLRSPTPNAASPSRSATVSYAQPQVAQTVGEYELVRRQLWEEYERAGELAKSRAAKRLKAVTTADALIESERWPMERLATMPGLSTDFLVQLSKTGLKPGSRVTSARIGSQRS
jgi:hypothetical protein